VSHPAQEIRVDEPEKARSQKNGRAPIAAEGVELITLEEVERRHVLRVLEACGGNRTDAAKILGLDRKTLYRKLLRWGVNKESPKLDG